MDRLPGRSARTGRRWRAARRGIARRAWCRGTPPAGWRGRGGAARRAPCAAATRPTWTWCAAPSWTCCAPCAPSATARGGPAAPRAGRRPPTRTSSCSGSTRAGDPSPSPSAGRRPHRRRVHNPTPLRVCCCSLWWRRGWSGVTGRPVGDLYTYRYSPA